MAASLLALGLDPERCSLFVQSHRPEVTELAWLLTTVTPVSWLERTPTYKEKKRLQPDDVNHGLLTYPVLQAADIVIYKASLVPVGKDQAAHLELTREIVRAFNSRYGDTFPEPQAVYTEAPTVLGTDGVHKMSKSLGNTIDILASPEVVRKQVMSMVTDTKRILRTDPGRPEVCNVCQLQPAFGDDFESLWEGERTARTGCVDMKKLLSDRIIEHYAEAREKYADLMDHPERVNETSPPAPSASGRSPRRRWTRSGTRWACAEGAMTASLVPGPRDRRLLSALLILGVIAVFFFIVSQLSQLFFYFGDIFLTFFLAWLLAFIISPLVSRIVDAIPRLPRAAATILVYVAVVLVLVLIVVVAAGALATSITQFAASIPDIRTNLPTMIAPWQQWLDSIGLGQIDLLAQAQAALANLDDIAAALIAPLQAIAVASLSVVGTLLIVFFLSIYMVLDRDDILAFLFRIVPPAYAEEARLLETSVSRSFGGFLRGQALMGAVYFLVALGTNLLLGLPLAALTSVLAGLLQMIPFFGPFISWAPPVVVALVLQPESALPALILMGAGWIVVMNVLQPRIMQGAVGIHPIVVLGSVLIGSRIAGIPGAIFGIPIAAVVSAFLLEFLHRTSADRTVAGRAARRLEERDGRPVRIPREPVPGSATDIDELVLDEPDPEPGEAADPANLRRPDVATPPP